MRGGGGAPISSDTFITALFKNCEETCRMVTVRISACEVINYIHFLKLSVMNITLTMKKYGLLNELIKHYNKA